MESFPNIRNISGVKTELKYFENFQTKKNIGHNPNYDNVLNTRYPTSFPESQNTRFSKTTVEPQFCSTVMTNLKTIEQSVSKSSIAASSDNFSLNPPRMMKQETPTNVIQIETPKIKNIVCSANLGCHLDLKWIAMHTKNAEYNPRRLPALIMRIREPRTTALIYNSGRMVCTGAKKEDQSRIAARKFARIIQKLGFQAKFLEFRILNLVGFIDMQFPIHLEMLSIANRSCVSYEPELFPGAVYHVTKPKTIALIFNSGKIVITGTKHRVDIAKTFEHIYPIIKTFKQIQQ